MFPIYDDCIPIGPHDGSSLGCTAAELGAYWRSTGWDQNWVSNGRPATMKRFAFVPFVSLLMLAAVPCFAQNAATLHIGIEPSTLHAGIEPSTLYVGIEPANLYIGIEPSTLSMGIGAIQSAYGN